MSGSPFLPPTRRRRRRRRDGRAAATGVLVAALLVVAAVVLVLTRPWSSHAAAAPPRGQTHPQTGAGGLARTAVPLSPTGLPLARPPLVLDLANPRADPLRVRFGEPPRAGVLIDLTSGRVLWQRNPLRRVRIASLTKMMTALLTVRTDPPDARVEITKQAEETSGSKVGVLPLGHHVRLESLLYGLLLPSGNDAAVALAQHVAGTVHHFVERMNEEAASLGMGCTRYSSPSGYYNTHNYSCAADLAELAREDLREPRIEHVASQRAAVLRFPIKGGKLYLYNNNPLLVYGYPGATGLKTGYTIEAGRCLVASAERHGVRLAVVLLHSPAPGIQARDLLDDAFRRVYHQRPVPEPPMPPGA